MKSYQEEADKVATIQREAGCGAGGYRKALGRFVTPELAYEAYLKYKKIRVSEVLELYKSRLDARVVLKLEEFSKE